MYVGGGKDDLAPQSTFLCRVQRCVWLASSKILFPPPLSSRRAVRGVNILEDARHRKGLLQYNLSTPGTNTPPGVIARSVDKFCAFSELKKL
jgi:hypothetical protein